MTNATDDKNIADELLSYAIAAGADSADIIVISGEDVSVSCRLGKAEELERSESKALGLRVWVGDKQAIVSTSEPISTSLGKESFKLLAQRAVDMAKVATADKHSKQAEKEIQASPDEVAKLSERLDLYDAYEPTVEELFEKAKIAEDTALSTKGITNSEGADAYHGTYSIMLATSKGFFATHKSSANSISLSVIAGTGENMERDYDYSTKVYYRDLASPEEIGKNAAEKALRRLNPKKIDTRQAPVIFDPRVSRGLVNTFASAISGATISKGTSFLKDDMGKQIFASNVQIIDNPHIVRGMASRPFDAEGVATKEMRFIDNGILQSWILDIRTASKLGLQTTGHASRGVSSPPSPSPSNLYMAAGQLTPSQLMAEVKSGLYVTETFGMGVNIVTGEYSQGAAGFWIENGEITYPVSEITIAGKLRDMFLRAQPANDLEFKYSTNAPTLLIENMTIAGS